MTPLELQSLRIALLERTLTRIVVKLSRDDPTFLVEVMEDARAKLAEVQAQAPDFEAPPWVEAAPTSGPSPGS